MKKLTVSVLFVVAFMTLGAAPPATAQIRVDAALRLSDHVIVAVEYGRPYVRRGVVYYDAYYYDDHGRRHRRVHRYLAKEHRRYHRATAHEHRHLHHALRHGYIGYYEHDRWHREVAYEHDHVHDDLDYKHHKSHKRGYGYGY